MNIASILPGWLIGFVVGEDDVTCEYRILPVISIIANPDGSLDAIVMSPDGKPARAQDIGELAFAAGPGDDLHKIATAHATTRGRTARSLAA